MIHMEVIRCLSKDRLAHRPEAGEALFCTDTGQFYFGDGRTSGGVESNRTAKELSTQEDFIDDMETEESQYLVHDVVNNDPANPVYYLLSGGDNSPIFAGQAGSPPDDLGDVGDVYIRY